MPFKVRKPKRQVRQINVIISKIVSVQNVCAAFPESYAEILQDSDVTSSWQSKRFLQSDFN